MTEALVLDHNGIGPDGGTPSPSCTFTENDKVSPTRIVSTDGEICIDRTGANVDCWVEPARRRPLGAVGLLDGTSEQLTQTAAIEMIAASVWRVASMSNIMATAIRLYQQHHGSTETQKHRGPNKMFLCFRVSVLP